MAADLHVTHHPGPDGAARVVLVHGAPDRSRSFRAVLPLIADLDVTTYDRRGYGESIDARPSTSLDDHVDDLVAILDERPATLVGHSFGCNVVMATAIRRPDLVRSIGVWELPIPWVEWWPTPDFRDGLRPIAESSDTEQLGEDFTRNGVGDDVWNRLSPERQQMLRTEGAAFSADLRSILGGPYDPADLAVPAVFACGATTTTGHREAAHHLADLLGAELMDVEGAGHFGHTAHPNAFVTMIRRAVAIARP